MELDTHADTTVLGRGCLIIQDFNRVVSVSGWNAAAGSTECPTVTGVVAYDHPYTGVSVLCFGLRLTLLTRGVRVHLNEVKRAER